MTQIAEDKKPRLTLVGAGPGDAELITLKGIKALQTADVVLYDALVNPDLLEYAPKKAPRIYVGKRAGQHSYTQQEINNLIVESAFTYGHVVRLKGGDPFVFGRGYEELTYAENFKITTTVVPGISSAIAVPALQQIPITMRGINESFWVVTGTTSAGEISKDIYLAAQSDATVVILMGMNKLEQIAGIFAELGKENIPVAVIQNGSMPDEKVVIGDISNIAAQAKRNGVGAPAIIVIGEVVSCHPSLRYVLVQSLQQ